MRQSFPGVIGWTRSTGNGLKALFYLKVFLNIITQWSCSAFSGSLWEMPDSNPGPLPKKSGALPKSQHISCKKYRYLISRHRYRCTVPHFQEGRQLCLALFDEHMWVLLLHQRSVRFWYVARRPDKLRKTKACTFGYLGMSIGIFESDYNYSTRTYGG